MGKSSKRKGSTYERKFISDVCEVHGLGALRVPLSGAMEHYKDDVVVEDTWRVEVKYRADGAGFTRLHGWLGEAPVLWLPKSKLAVLTDETWAELCRAELGLSQGPPELKGPTKNVTPRETMLEWMGEADALALRKARSPWLVCLRMSDPLFAK